MRRRERLSLALVALLAAAPFLLAPVELPDNQVPNQPKAPGSPKLPEFPPQLTGLGAPACAADGAVFPAQGVSLAGAAISCKTDCPGVKSVPGTGPGKTPACVIKGHPEAGASCSVEMRVGKTMRARKVKTCPARWRITLDAPARVAPGERVRATVGVRNEGGGEAPYKGKFYLSSDEGIRSQAQVFSHRRLAPGRSSSHRVSIARAPAAGQYELCASIGGGKPACRALEVAAEKAAAKGAEQAAKDAPSPGTGLAGEALPGGLETPAAEALRAEALGEQGRQVREFKSRFGSAKLPLISTSLLQINGDRGPVVNVPEGDTVEASWSGARAFAEGLGEELRRHWLVVSETALAENSCVVDDEDALPDAGGIDGDGRHGASTFSRELRGLAADTTYHVKLCMQTRRPGASPEDAWRHESQQIRLNHGEGAFTGGEGEGGWIGLLEPPSPEDIARVMATTRAEAPDLVVQAISLSVDPGGGAGQLLIRFRDDRGEAHFRGYYDGQQGARRRAGQPADPEDIYPFGYEVFVDGLRVPHAGGRSYLPRSSRKHVVTERYWLPGDGSSHEVRVVATPVFVDHNPRNNALTVELTAEAQTEPHFSVTGFAVGSAFSIPGEPPFTSFIGDRHTKLVAAPGIDVGGYFYSIETTRGAFGGGACVNSRSVNITVAGTVGDTRLTRVGAEIVGTGERHEHEFRGRRQIDGVWHEAGAPYEFLQNTWTINLQDLIQGNNRPLTVRGWVVDERGREYSKELRFVLAGSYFTPATGMVQMAVNRVRNDDTGEWSTASRGATDVTINGRRESLTLNGRVRLNPDNCALRDTRVDEIIVGLNEVSEPNRFGMIVGVSNVYDIARGAGEARFQADYNIRNGLTEPAGRYELQLGLRFNNIVPARPGMLPSYSATPPMLVTVER